MLQRVEWTIIHGCARTEFTFDPAAVVFIDY
jgi:hypothetical protein